MPDLEACRLTSTSSCCARLLARPHAARPAPSLHARVLDARHARRSPASACAASCPTGVRAGRRAAPARRGGRRRADLHLRVVEQPRRRRSAEQAPVPPTAPRRRCPPGGSQAWTGRRARGGAAPRPRRGAPLVAALRLADARAPRHPPRARRRPRCTSPPASRPTRRAGRPRARWPARSGARSRVHPRAGDVDRCPSLRVRRRAAALRYDTAAGGAPKVVAAGRGRGRRADHRAGARENGVPVREDARAGRGPGAAAARAGDPARAVRRGRRGPGVGLRAGKAEAVVAAPRERARLSRPNGLAQASSLKPRAGRSGRASRRRPGRAARRRRAGRAASA